MKYTVGQQLLGGFFVVVSVDSSTGNAVIASQFLGNNGGPFVATITPSVTVQALSNLAAAVLALV